uniref:RING-type domain-containing protein n=1 Tax=Setaria digitata TaxID=48799 RepID=A0A915PNG7_9BILA
MSGCGATSLFSNATSVVLPLIGTFVLAVQFGCVFKSRGARISETRVWFIFAIEILRQKASEVFGISQLAKVTIRIYTGSKWILNYDFQKMRRESVILHENEDAEALVAAKPNQTAAEKHIHPKLIKLIESTQNSVSSSVKQRQVLKQEKKESTLSEKKDNEEKPHKNRRSEQPSLIKETAKSDLRQLKGETQSTQQDDIKDSKTKSQVKMLWKHYLFIFIMRILGTLCRKHRSERGRHYRRNEEEAFAKTQTREEEPSTLEGVASISRDDTPSTVSQLRLATVKMNLIPKKRCLSKASHTRGKHLYTYTVTWHDLQKYEQPHSVDELELPVASPQFSFMNVSSKQDMSPSDMQICKSIAPCNALRSRPVSEMRIMGLCDHYICRDCFENAPAVETAGGFGCPNIRCYQTDLACLCTNAHRRRRKIQEVMTMSPYGVASVIGTDKDGQAVASNESKGVPCLYLVDVRLTTFTPLRNSDKVCRQQQIVEMYGNYTVSEAINVLKDYTRLSSLDISNHIYCCPNGRINERSSWKKIREDDLLKPITKFGHEDQRIDIIFDCTAC